MLKKTLNCVICSALQVKKTWSNAPIGTIKEAKAQYSALSSALPAEKSRHSVTSAALLCWRRVLNSFTMDIWQLSARWSTPHTVLGLPLKSHLNPTLTPYNCCGCQREKSHFYEKEQLEDFTGSSLRAAQQIPPPCCETLTPQANSSDLFNSTAQPPKLARECTLVAMYCSASCTAPCLHVGFVWLWLWHS